MPLNWIYPPIAEHLQTPSETAFRISIVPCQKFTFIYLSFHTPHVLARPLRVSGILLMICTSAEHPYVPDPAHWVSIKEAERRMLYITPMARNMPHRKLLWFKPRMMECTNRNSATFCPLLHWFGARFIPVLLRICMYMEYLGSWFHIFATLLIKSLIEPTTQIEHLQDSFAINHIFLKRSPGLGP